MRNIRGLALVAATAMVFCVGCEPPKRSWTPVTPEQLIGEWATATSVMGKTVDFAHGKGGERYRTSGWTGPDPGMPFTWTEGESAKLVLPIAADPGPLKLKMMLGGMVNPPDLPAQDVQVFVNGVKAADLQVSAPAEFEVDVPAESTGSAQLQIEFRVPRAASPLSLGHSSDSRVLGIYLFKIAVLKRA